MGSAAVTGTDGPLLVRSLAGQVCDLLRSRIVPGAVRPGDRIELEEVAGELGVSTTPVRDALRLLEREGLVVIHPRRGVYAARVEAETFRDVFDARIALECLALDTAIERIPAAALDELAQTYAAAADAWARTKDEVASFAPSDSRIHDLIVDHCRNTVVRELMASLRSRIAWARGVSAAGAHSYAPSFPEHRAILEAMRQGNRRRSVGLLRDHLTRTRDRTLAVLESAPEQ